MVGMELCVGFSWRCDYVAEVCDNVVKVCVIMLWR